MSPSTLLYQSTTAQWTLSKCQRQGSAVIPEYVCPLKIIIPFGENDYKKFVCNIIVPTPGWRSNFKFFDWQDSKTRLVNMIKTLLRNSLNPRKKFEGFETFKIFTLLFHSCVKEISSWNFKIFDWTFIVQNLNIFSGFKNWVNMSLYMSYQNAVFY